MKIIKIALQIVGLFLLVPAVTLATMRFEHRNADGPSILFPGGALVSGDLHAGPEPDWSFTAAVDTIELELDSSDSSRLIWIMDAEGQAYIVSGYMSSFIERLWKHWAVEADAGDGLAVLRVNGVRYERQLERVMEGDELNGVAASLIRKYAGGNDSPQAIAAVRGQIEAGSTWAFRLAPRG